LLQGQAVIGGAPYVLRAMCVDPVSLLPDLRASVDEGIYMAYELIETLEELEFFADLQRPSLGVQSRSVV
jgi:hypothetical protein